jgi:hypothetical protein
LEQYPVNFSKKKNKSQTVGHASQPLPNPQETSETQIKKNFLQEPSRHNETERKKIHK